VSKPFSTRKKIQAVEALNAGERVNDVLKRFKCSSPTLYDWRKKYAAGEYGKPNGVAAETPAPKPKKPGAMFDDRVRRAIVLLREVEAEVDRMKREGKLREADSAHLHAILALRILQGDNGR
jgi:transposase-like protein